MANPNILLIITDQQRTDTLGFLGQTPCQTPNIDRLAAEGISFDRAMTTCPLCAPARASIFTGQYPHQVDMMRNDTGLQTPPTLTDRQKARGYHTAYAGKWHLDAQRPPYLGEGASGSALADQEKPALARWFDQVGADSTAAYSEWCLHNGIPDGWAFNDPAVRTTRTPAMSIPKPAIMDLAPNRVCLAARRQRESLKNPPKTVEEFLAILEKQRLQRTVAQLRKFMESL